MTLFDIKKAEVVELQVEKNEYKVKAFIGKTDSDLDVHWIYLNRKCIHNSSKLHKMINDNFKKVLPIKDRRKVKYKVNYIRFTKIIFIMLYDVFCDLIFKDKLIF